jgi:hypothetical protein
MRLIYSFAFTFGANVRSGTVSKLNASQERVDGRGDRVGEQRKFWLFAADKLGMLHVTEDALEEYVLLHLSEHEADAIEKHVFSCAKCRRRLTSTKEFIRDIRTNLGGTLGPRPAVRKRVVVLPIRR